MGGTILTGDPFLIKAGPRNTRRSRMDSQLNKTQGTSNQKNKMGRHVEIMGRGEMHTEEVCHPILYAWKMVWSQTQLCHMRCI